MRLPLLLAFQLTLAAALHAQSEYCDYLSITQFMLDEETPNQWLVTIAFNAESNAFISYPVIDAMFDTNGDTIATGSLFFFGQLGGGFQNYPVTPVDGATPTSFSITFSFLNGDVNESCTLFYNLPISVEPTLATASIRAFPNPMGDQLHIAFPLALEGSRYRCVNALGQTISTGLVGRADNMSLDAMATNTSASFNVSIETPSWPSGVYYIVLENHAMPPLRVVK